MLRSTPTKLLRIVWFLPLLLLLSVVSASAGLLIFVEVQKDGIGGVDGLAGASFATVSPDGAHVYAAGAGDDAVVVFSRDGTTGRLTFVEAQKDGVGGADGLAGAESVTVSPDGAYVYAVGEVDNAVAVFSRDETTGTLTFVEMQQDGVGGIDGLSHAQSVAVSPDGAHIYVAGEGDDAVAVFSRDGTSGRLTFVEVQKDGVGGVDGLRGATFVTVSPDGAHIYAAAEADSAVAVFSREGVTGALTFVEVQRGGVSGSSVTVSPDGAHVYAGGGGGVMVFSREGATGALTFVEVQRDGVGGSSVTVSPDGSYVYAVGDDALAAFSRDGATGRLTFVEAHKDGVGGVDGLAWPESVVVSPDGAHIYTAGDGDDAVAVFSYAGHCPEPVRDVTISGPATVLVGRSSPFGASVLPVDATLPITYTWLPEPNSGQGTGEVAYTWANTGAVTLTLTAENCGALVADTHKVDVREPFPVYLPIVMRGW